MTQTVVHETEQAAIEAYRKQLSVLPDSPYVDFLAGDRAAIVAGFPIRTTLVRVTFRILARCPHLKTLKLVDCSPIRNYPDLRGAILIVENAAIERVATKGMSIQADRSKLLNEDTVDSVLAAAAARSGNRPLKEFTSHYRHYRGKPTAVISNWENVWIW